jgi:hypothetical protein
MPHLIRVRGDDLTDAAGDQFPDDNLHYAVAVDPKVEFGANILRGEVCKSLPARFPTAEVS